MPRISVSAALSQSRECHGGSGAHNILIPNPRDIPGFVKELQKQKFTAFIGLNTLFVALCNNEDFQDLDFSGLKLTASGGMALTSDTAKMWERVTGCEISERSEEHTSELQSRPHLVCRLLLEKK